MQEKRIIGRVEMVDLPELGLYHVPAKVDTGAETSVLHCDHYEIFAKDGRRYIRCSIDGLPDFTFLIHRERVIKSSFGQAETRHIFITKIKLFDTLFDIKLSVRDRSNMSYPMLLGRNFISGKFLVDVSLDHFVKKLNTRS